MKKKFWFPFSGLLILLTTGCNSSYPHCYLDDSRLVINDVEVVLNITTFAYGRHYEYCDPGIFPDFFQAKFYLKNQTDELRTFVFDDPVVVRESNDCMFQLDSPTSQFIIPLSADESRTVPIQTNLPTRHTEEHYYIQFSGVIFYLYDNPD